MAPLHPPTGYIHATTESVVIATERRNERLANAPETCCARFKESRAEDGLPPQRPCRRHLDRQQPRRWLGLGGGAKLAAVGDDSRRTQLRFRRSREALTLALQPTVWRPTRASLRCVESPFARLGEHASSICSKAHRTLVTALDRS